MSLHIMNTSATGNRFNHRAATNFLGARGFGVRYPSPFFDVAQQFLPENVHQLHLWCRYYFLTNPIVNVACQKMAEYPVTPIVWETEDRALKTLYSDVEESLRLQQFQVEVGLDYFVYGNAFVSVMFGLEKWLVCTKCGHRYQASKNRSLYKWKNGRFILKCQNCGHHGRARQSDAFPRNARSARLVRWNPENVEVKHSSETGITRYFYRLPRRTLNDIKMGDPFVIENLPHQFLDAARKGRALEFTAGNLYHLKRPTIAQKDQGWGTPLIFPLLKDAFYLQVMKKAQESLLMEHVVPLRMIFPGPSTGGNDGPMGSYNLANWKAKIDSELNIWKRDHNYIPILPVNVGYQQVGGTARALILHQEFRLHAEMMLAGAGIPVEFVFGGLQYSASNTSLKALENTFLGYNRQRYGLLKFCVRKIASHMGWPWCPFKFDKFKMADDLQRDMFFFQLNQAQKISDRTLLNKLGEDFDAETERMKEELAKQMDTQRTMQIASADVQGAAQLRQSHYQAKAQKFMQKAQLEAQMEVQMEANAAGMPEAAQQGGDQEGGQQGQQPPEQGGQGDQAQNVEGMPEGATAYDENADSANQQAMPTAIDGMQSRLQQGQDIGLDLRYVAQRAAAYLRDLREADGPQAMHQELERMMTQNPNLYRMVIPLMEDGGSRQDPTNPMISRPGASQRPEGRFV